MILKSVSMICIFYKLKFLTGNVEKNFVVSDVKF